MMAQVTVTIAGRTFRMACGDGEEPHLESLAKLVDEKIAELRTAFGEIGDQRLTVMAAISVADELSETKRRIAKLEANIASLREAQEQTSGMTTAMTDTLASALENAAVRIEGVAKGMR
jgi:cell division protein ZapA